MACISAISSLAPRPSLPYCLAQPPHQRCLSGTHESPKVTPTWTASSQSLKVWQKTDGTEDEHKWHGGRGRLRFMYEDKQGLPKTDTWHTHSCLGFAMPGVSSLGPEMKYVYNSSTISRPYLNLTNAARFQCWFNYMPQYQWPLISLLNVFISS